MRRTLLNMKNFILFISVNISILSAQFSYPAQDFLGGGIGYSPMYISLDSIPGSHYLSGLGLKPENFDNPFVIHGGEGFAHVTGRWRIGGYAGMGATAVSTIPDIIVFKDNLNGEANGVFDQGEDSKDYTSFFNPTIEAKFSFYLGAASVEYVMPVFQDLELSAGALMGLGRAAISVDEQNGNPRWERVFSNVYGTMDSTGTLYYGDSADEYDDPDITPGEVPGLLRDVSATFFNFQPYVAIKWQFLERLGLRISAGFNKGTVREGKWVLNGKNEIKDSPASALQGVSFRTMLYIGL